MTHTWLKRISTGFHEVDVLEFYKKNETRVVTPIFLKIIEQVTEYGDKARVIIDERYHLYTNTKEILSKEAFASVTQEPVFDLKNPNHRQIVRKRLGAVVVFMQSTQNTGIITTDGSANIIGMVQPPVGYERYVTVYWDIKKNQWNCTGLRVPNLGIGLRIWSHRHV